jgi:hypothetical protein
MGPRGVTTSSRPRLHQTRRIRESGSPRQYLGSSTSSGNRATTQSWRRDPTPLTHLATGHGKMPKNWPVNSYRSIHPRPLRTHAWQVIASGAVTLLPLPACGERGFTAGSDSKLQTRSLTLNLRARRPNSDNSLKRGEIRAAAQAGLPWRFGGGRQGEQPRPRWPR